MAPEEQCSRTANPTSMPHMTYDECLERLQVEQAKLLPMKEELTTARARAAQHGDYMAAEAYARLDRRVHSQGQLCQRLQTELARLKRQRAAVNRATDYSVPHRFVSVARRRLLPDVFASLMQEAEDGGERAAGEPVSDAAPLRRVSSEP